MSEPYFFNSADEAYIKKEREKARKLRFTNWWRTLVSKGECYYCGGKFSKDEITMDHIVPLSRGGTSSKNNIVACCKNCNNIKKNKLPLEWEEYLEKLKK